MTAEAAAGGIALTARAKVNLYLHVLARRDDGFHELDSLIAFADYGDRILVTPADGITLTTSGPFAEQLPTETCRNLVHRATHELARATGVRAGAAIRLVKNLPVASGIGGGSADAAATLEALATLWGLAPGAEQLTPVARHLGADVPACLDGRNAFVSGVGESVAPTPALPEADIVLVNPGVPVATPEVFARCSPRPALAGPFEPWPRTVSELATALARGRNDLTAAARSIAPVIGVVLTALEQASEAQFARMSGSGATCFALCSDRAAACALESRLAGAHPDWWVVATRLSSKTKGSE